MDLPVRKHLPHQPPPSVSHYARGADFFLTICVDRPAYGIEGEDVGRVGPLTGNVAVRILCALTFYQARGLLDPSDAVVMPDHIHLVARFPEGQSPDKIVRAFKAYAKKEFGVVWQSGYFDHRIRNEKDLSEKTDYVRMNPVRKGLCSSPEAWPFRMTWRRG